MKFIILFIGLYFFFFISGIVKYFNKRKKLVYLKGQFEHSTILKDEVFKFYEKNLDSIPEYDYVQLEDIQNEAKKDANKEMLNILFKLNPIINELFPDLFIEFSLNDSFYNTTDKKRRTYNSIMNSINYHDKDLTKVFNPFKVLKNIFLLPSTILTWFGINLGKYTSRIFSALSIAIGIMLKTYGDSILNWVLSLFK